MDQYHNIEVTQAAARIMDRPKNERREGFRNNSNSNHRRLKPAGESSFGQLGNRNKLWVASLHDMQEHQISQPALSNFNSILHQQKQKKDLANSMSPRATATGSSSNQTQMQSILEKVPRPRLARPQSGRNRVKREVNHQSSGYIRSPTKKKGSIMNLPSESPNVFSRLTSGISGLNGTQSKIKTQKKSDWMDAYGDLEGDLSSATQFQNKFRRSLYAPSSMNNISGSNQSNNSREAFKNVSNVRDGVQGASVGLTSDQPLTTAFEDISKRASHPGPLNLEENYGTRATGDGQADTLKSAKANRIPKRKKPPRLPNAANTVSNSLLTTSAKPKLEILDESKDNFQDEFEKDVAAGSNDKHHHSTIQVKEERIRPGYVSSTPREKEDRPRSNQTQNIIGFPKRSMMVATSYNEFPSVGQDSTSIATSIVNRAQRSRARKYNRPRSSRKRASQTNQESEKRQEEKEGQEEKNEDAQLDKLDSLHQSKEAIKKQDDDEELVNKEDEETQKKQQDNKSNSPKYARRFRRKKSTNPQKNGTQPSSSQTDSNKRKPSLNHNQTAVTMVQNPPGGGSQDKQASSIRNQKLSSQSKRMKKRPVEIEDDTWNDSFFGGGTILGDDSKGDTINKTNYKDKKSNVRTFDYRDQNSYEREDDISKGQMDLDELLDDGLTTEGKLTMNQNSENLFNSRKHSEQQRMVTTVNDGQSMRFNRRQRVSKNYREMQNSIELSNKRSNHRNNQMRSIERGSNEVNVSGSYAGGLTKSLASTLMENKEKLKQMRDEDERERTVERERRERIERQSLTIESCYESQIPKDTGTLLSIDMNAEKCKVQEEKAEGDETNLKSPQSSPRPKERRDDQGTRLTAHFNTTDNREGQSKDRGRSNENVNSSGHELNINTTLANHRPFNHRPPLSVKKDHVQHGLTMTNKQLRGRRPLQNTGIATEFTEPTQRSKDKDEDIQSIYYNKVSSRQGSRGSSRPKRPPEREGTQGPCQRSMASGVDGADQTTVAAGTVTNYPRDLKEHSLALEDIVLESELLDIEKIKGSITFEQFLRQQVRIIKKSRSRSRGVKESSEHQAEQADEEQPKTRHGSPYRDNTSRANSNQRSDTSRLARLKHWVQKRFGEHSIYVGGLGEESERSGQGVMKYKNGRQYEGSWLDDHRHGDGFERYQNGNTYEGRFTNGKAHGHGVYRWANGEIYDGEWNRGLKHGHGLWKGIRSDSYVGEWFKSQAHGYGVHVWPNGDRYEGEWKMGLKHGNGTDQLACGDTYVGEYEQGKMHGRGVYTWENGQSYNGDYVHGKRHGKGQWRSSNNLTKCSSYEGQYKQDKKHGQGVYTWASGNIYKGEYWEDERNGFGRMEWIDGSIYEGEWLNGIQHGFGKMTFPSGKIKEGIFEDNVFKGKSDEIGKKKDRQGANNQSQSGSQEREKEEKGDEPSSQGFNFHQEKKDDDMNNMTIQTDADGDGLAKYDVEIKTGKAQRQMMLQSPDKMPIINQTQVIETRENKIPTGLKKKKKRKKSNEAHQGLFMSHLKDNPMSLAESHLEGNTSHGKKKNQNNNFMEQARTTVQDHLRFMDQTSINQNSELGDEQSMLFMKETKQQFLGQDDLRLEDWDEDREKSRITVVPEEAQQNYQQKLELLKSQLKSDQADNSFANAANVNEPKSVVQSKSRMRTLQQFEETHGSKTELKKRRIQDGVDNQDEPDPFLKQIQKAIIDERSDRKDDKAVNKIEKPKKPPKAGDFYAKEDLKDWSTYKENF